MSKCLQLLPHPRLGDQCLICCCLFVVPQAFTLMHGVPSRDNMHGASQGAAAAAAVTCTVQACKYSGNLSMLDVLSILLFVLCQASVGL